MPRVLGLSASLLRSAARALLVSLSVAALGPVLHDAHGDRCDPPLVVHDARQHHIQSAQPGDTRSEDHCVACHFARASRGPAAWEASGLTTLVDVGLSVDVERPVVGALSAARLPARAPPLV